MCMFLAATNGVVIATEKKMPSVLIDEKQMQKIEVINPSTGTRALAAAMPLNLQSTDDSRRLKRSSSPVRLRVLRLGP